MMTGEKTYFYFITKKETVNETTHLQADLLIPNVLLLISAVLFIAFYLTWKYPAAEPNFSKSKVNFIQPLF